MGMVTGSLLVSLGHWSMQLPTSFTTERVYERFPGNRQVLTMVSETPSSTVYLSWVMLSGLNRCYDLCFHQTIDMEFFSFYLALGLT